MKKNVLTSIVSIISYLLALVPLVTLAISWSSIPAVVPVHIGFDGKIDRWGSKWELIIVAVIIAVLFISIVTALRLSLLGNNRETVHVSKKRVEQRSILRIFVFYPYGNHCRCVINNFFRNSSCKSSQHESNYFLRSRSHINYLWQYRAPSINT